MAQIIEDIIATDKTAREIVKKAQAKREIILQDAKREEERILNEGKERLERLNAELTFESEAYLSSLAQQINDEYVQKRALLDERYDANEQKWVNDIITRLTK